MNIFSGFRKHRHHEDDAEYRRSHYRSDYHPSYPGPHEYTGQPLGFEHMGSPPKQKLSDMDAKTIAQLGYEGPEGERRKVEAINDQIYEREHDFSGYPPRHDVYDREGYRRSRDSYGDDDYPESDPRYRRGYDRYGRPRPPGYVRPLTVHVDRKYEEDGTIVENVYPESRGGSIQPDPAKIHYGRQESFPEMALEEAAAAYVHDRHRYGRRDYPSGYAFDRPPLPDYAPPYSGATSSHMRRHHYDGSGNSWRKDRDNTDLLISEGILEFQFIREVREADCSQEARKRNRLVHHYGYLEDFCGIGKGQATSRSWVLGTMGLVDFLRSCKEKD